MDVNKNNTLENPSKYIQEMEFYSKLINDMYTYHSRENKIENLSNNTNIESNILLILKQKRIKLGISQEEI